MYSLLLVYKPFPTPGTQTILYPWHTNPVTVTVMELLFILSCLEYNPTGQGGAAASAQICNLRTESWWGYACVVTPLVHEEWNFAYVCMLNILHTEAQPTLTPLVDAKPWVVFSNTHIFSYAMFIKGYDIVGSYPYLWWVVSRRVEWPPKIPLSL